MKYNIAIIFFTIFISTSLFAENEGTSYILYATYNFKNETPESTDIITKTKLHIYNFETKHERTMTFKGLLENFSWHPTEKKILFLHSNNTHLGSMNKKNIQILEIENNKIIKTNIYAVGCSWIDNGKSIAYIKYYNFKRRYRETMFINKYNLKSKKITNLVKARNTFFERISSANNFLYIDYVSIHYKPRTHSKWGILKINYKNKSKRNILRINQDLHDVTVNKTGNKIVFSSIMDGANGFYLMDLRNNKFKKFASGFGYGFDEQSRVGISLSPNGEKISFVSSKGNCYLCVFVLNIKNKKDQIIYHFPFDNTKKNIHPPYETAWSNYY